jgi:hypothetical protein
MVSREEVRRRKRGESAWADFVSMKQRADKDESNHIRLEESTHYQLSSFHPPAKSPHAPVVNF